MKKTLPLFFVLLLLTLTACAGQTGGVETSSLTEISQSNPDGENIAAPVTPPAGSEAPKFLVAYFSRSGNTEQIAMKIQAGVGGDLFRIETSESYPESYDAVLEIAREEQSRDARPELAAAVEDMSNYSVIFLGYPIWWGEAPMAVLTFLESYNLTGKTIIPFCTYGSSGFGNSVERLKYAAPNSLFLEGFGTGSSQAASADEAVIDWLSRLGYIDG